MIKNKFILLFILFLIVPLVGQSQERNFIVYPIKGYIFLWPFPTYWINNQVSLQKADQPPLFYLSGYSINNSIAHFGIGFGDDISSISMSGYSEKVIAQFKRNAGNDYTAENVTWNIYRKDSVPMVIFKLSSNNRTMFQYCAIMENVMRNYIIAFIQLNSNSKENEKYINDFKIFLETVVVREGILDL